MTKGMAVLALAVIGAALILLAPDPPPPTPEERAADLVKAKTVAAAERFAMAMIRCRGETADQLADPEGFEPVPYGEWRMLETSEDRHVVTFRARARNGFGALVWAEFQCTVTHDGQRWTAEIEQL